MSYTFLYNPEPGIVADIVKLSTIKLNPKSIWAPISTLAESYEYDVEYIENFSKQFTIRYSKLLLFFYKMPNHPATFLSTQLMKQFQQDFTHFSLDTFLASMQNSEQLKNDLFSYYLGSHDYTHISLEPIIRKHPLLPDKIKVLLLGFLLDTDTYIRHLTVQMRSFYKDLSPYHIAPDTDIIPTDTLINALIDTEFNNPCEIKKGLNNKTISYAYCFSIYHHMFAHFRSQTPWLIFAPSSLQNIPTNRKTTTPNSITEIAKVLSDPTRITILQLLFSYDSMSIKDLLPYVKCSRSTLCHHLTHLENTQLILSKNQDSTKRYRYNAAGFKQASDIFYQISQGKFHA